MQPRRRDRPPTATPTADQPRLVPLIADYLAACPEVTAEGTRIAGRMVAVVVDEVTHGAVINPPGGDDPDTYAREMITMLERYLTAPPRR